MIYGDKFRPLVMAGSEIYNKYFLGKVVKNVVSNTKSDYIQVLSQGHEHLFEKGYCGYLFESDSMGEEIYNYLIKNKIPSYRKVNYIETVIDNDIIEIGNDEGIIRVLYRADSTDNALVLTNQCNCNCVMCPDAAVSRQACFSNNSDSIKRLISLIDKKAKFLCITGGEPTLLKKDFLDIIMCCKDSLPNTQFILLTNGRMFYYKDFVDSFISVAPKNNMVIGIPLHAHEANLYDEISGVPGSYHQVMYGIHNLYNKRQKIELRVVVSNKNYRVLPDIAKFIAKNFPNVYRVNFMALEMMGNAIVNKDTVWVDFEKVKPFIKNASITLIKSGISTFLYNFPLCGLEPELWSLSVNSITDHKVRYKDECSSCTVINKCGGFFNSTINLKELKVKPVICGG